MMRKAISVFLVAGAFLGASFSLRAGEPSDSQAPVAMIGGKPLYEEDLRPLIQAQLQQLKNQEYQIKSKATETLISQKLLEAAAKENSLTVEELIKRDVEAKAQEPTEGEVETFYLGQKEKLNRPFDEVKAQLRQSLKQMKIQQARDDYMKRLRMQANVTVLVMPPKVRVGFDAARVRGSANAPVTIVEFSDFQCPYCQRVVPAMKDLLTRYNGQVRLAYRDFPLTQIHPQAQVAAEASRCAGAEGQYWAYHDLLFNNQAKLDAASLTDYARSLKLDGAKFEQCLASGKYKGDIERDVQEGIQAGVTGTPAFFINGVFLNGAQSTESFVRVIEEELARTRPIAAR